MSAFDEFMTNAFQSGWGYWVFPLSILVTFILLYKLPFKAWRRYLFRTYHYNLMGRPALIAMAIYFFTIAIPTITGSGFAPGTGGGDDLSKMIDILVVGLPGITLITIHGLIKTRNLLVVLVNIPVMYLVCFLLSYIFVGVLCFAMVGGFTKNLLGSMYAPVQCTNCGYTGSGGDSCSHCGASFVIT